VTNLRNAFPKTEESEEMAKFFSDQVVEELEELLCSAPTFSWDQTALDLSNTADLLQVFDKSLTSL